MGKSTRTQTQSVSKPTFDPSTQSLINGLTQKVETGTTGDVAAQRLMRSLLPTDGTESPIDTYTNDLINSATATSQRELTTGLRKTAGQTYRSGEAFRGQAASDVSADVAERLAGITSQAQLAGLDYKRQVADSLNQSAFQGDQTALALANLKKGTTTQEQAVSKTSDPVGTGSKIVGTIAVIAIAL